MSGCGAHVIVTRLLCKNVFQFSNTKQLFSSFTSGTGQEINHQCLRILLAMFLYLNVCVCMCSCVLVFLKVSQSTWGSCVFISIPVWHEADLMQVNDVNITAPYRFENMKLRCFVSIFVSFLLFLWLNACLFFPACFLCLVQNWRVDPWPGKQTLLSCCKRHDDVFIDDRHVYCVECSYALCFVFLLTLCF